MERPSTDELPLITATYDLLRDLVPVIDGMPRARKFTHADRLEQRLLRDPTGRPFMSRE